MEWKDKQNDIQNDDTKQNKMLRLTHELTQMYNSDNNYTIKKKIFNELSNATSIQRTNN